MGRLFRGLKPSEDPTAKAQELTILLSNTIVAELNDAAIRAIRLEPGALTPQDGLLVGGEFLELDEGNRMRRAMVGFGAGSEEVKVQVEVYDLQGEFVLSRNIKLVKEVSAASGHLARNRV